MKLFENEEILRAALLADEKNVVDTIVKFLQNILPDALPEFDKFEEVYGLSVQGIADRPELIDEVMRAAGAIFTGDVHHWPSGWDLEKFRAIMQEDNMVQRAYKGSGLVAFMWFLYIKGVQTLLKSEGESR